MRADQSPSRIEDLARQLHAVLRERTDITVATAESLTGGGICAALTSVAGSSAYVMGGVVAYSNAVKAGVLGVPADTLKNPGAVSEPTARAMAEGARRLLGTTFAVASTGIAGPDGGTARKPVGRVYLAVAGPAGTTVEEHTFPGDRAAVIAASIEGALRLLRAGVADRLGSA